MPVPDGAAMHPALSFLAALIALGGLGFDTSEVATATAPRPQAAVFTYDSFTARHHELVDWALALFDQANLDLPSVHFVASAGYEPCRGGSGIARHDDRASEITLCGERIGPAYDWLVLHELAHAFERHGLDDARREAFLALRGMTAWREGGWHDRGAEHAA